MAAKEEDRPTKKQQWLANIQRENLPLQDKDVCVCEIHFAEDQFEFDLQVRVKNESKFIIIEAYFVCVVSHIHFFVWGEYINFKGGGGGQISARKSHLVFRCIMLCLGNIAQKINTFPT